MGQYPEPEIIIYGVELLKPIIFSIIVGAVSSYILNFSKYSSLQIGFNHCIKKLCNLGLIHPCPCLEPALFSLRDVLTFVASGLDINGCVLSYFEGTANVHCYTSCTHTTLHCSRVSFLQCCHMKMYNKIFTKL